MEIYDKFPIQYGTPYPQTLMQKIEERIEIDHFGEGPGAYITYISFNTIKKK